MRAGLVAGVAVALVAGVGPAFATPGPNPNIASETCNAIITNGCIRGANDIAKAMADSVGSTGGSNCGLVIGSGPLCDELEELLHETSTTVHRRVAQTIDEVDDTLPDSVSVVAPLGRGERVEVDLPGVP